MYEKERKLFLELLEPVSDIEELYDMIVTDFIVFCLYIIGMDTKVTNKEMDYLADVLGLEIDAKYAIETYNNTPWEQYRECAPKFLDVLLENDKKQNNKFENSSAKSFINVMLEIGASLAASDGLVKDEKEQLIEYIDHLSTHSEAILDSPAVKPQTQASKTKNTNKAKAAKPPQQTTTNTKPVQKDKKTDKKLDWKPEDAGVKPKFKAADNAKPTDTSPASYMEFWQALKPSLDKLRFKGFANIKLIEYEWLNCKPNTIVGVYHSVGIIKTKKKIRLDCYIDTATEAGNLQIIDYVKSHYKPVKSIKERMVFDRKEGRRAQRISLYLDDFDLDDRSCWDRYIKEFVSVADDFVDAIDSKLKELI
jgi:hypothetical protein